MKTMKKAKPNLESDFEALKVAFSERISGRLPERRGNGLKFVKENVEIRKMRLIFQSGNAIAELNKEMKIEKTDLITRGCLAILYL